MRLNFVQLWLIVGAWYAGAMVRGSPNARYLKLPARLRKARKTAGLTRMALAQRAGGGQTVSLDIETGQRLPTVGTLARLASALGVAATWLAYGLGEQYTDDPPATTDGMGARLATVRVEQGTTKAALARLVNLSPSALANIENGGQTGVDVVEALAKALNISPAWLAFNRGPRELPKRRRAAKPTAPAHP